MAATLARHTRTLRERLRTRPVEFRLNLTDSTRAEDARPVEFRLT